MGASATLRPVAAAGFLIFGIAFIVIARRPDIVEQRAHDFVVRKVSQSASRILASPDSLVSEHERLTRLSRHFAGKADTLRARLNAGLSAQIAAALASMCNYCTSADSLEPIVTSFAEWRVGELQQFSARAVEWARNRYTETVRALVRDLRVFAGVNALLFLVVVVGSRLTRLSDGPQPTVALWLLLGTTVAAIVCYVGLQDWFLTLLTGRFIGIGYGIWVMVVLFLLMDWVLNRGRVTRVLTIPLG